jgi:TolB-like protein
LIYSFDKFHLDTERQELWRGRDIVPVEPQVFDLIAFLVSNRDRVVSKDEMISSVWNGRIVSDSTLSSRINAARQALGDSGEEQRLIRTHSRRGIRFVGSVEEERDDGSRSISKDEAASRGESPVRSSIAVLPFTNLSGDSEQEYFADGITEDLITALSQFRWLFVIAKSSSFVFRNKVGDAKEIARQLGVRYLLEGSVRKAPNRVRIAAQLIDATSGTHLWADKFDGALEDIFDVQDRVTASVVGAIAPRLEQAEIERATRKPTENLDAYDLYLRGVAHTVLVTRDEYDEALRLFREAIRLDPEFAAAYGMASWCYVTQKVNGWFVDTAADVAEGAKLAREAVRRAKGDAVALCWGGFSLGYIAHELDDAIAYVDKALVLNPNLAAGWYLGGWLRVYAGDPEGGLERLKKAVQLSPLDPLIFRAHAGIAYAHFFAGRNDEALEWAEKALRERPNWLTAIRIGAACQAVAGRLDKARALMTRMRELDPAVRLSNLGEVIPIRRPSDFAKWSDALRSAGLPE